MKKSFTVLILMFSCSFSGFSQNKNYEKETESGYKGGIIKGIKTLDKSLNFAVIGDWGRHGEYYQKEVADKLADAIVGVGASFIISTGDNIYPSGVASEYDPQWRSAFEDVYTRHATFIKWYVTLGNHDYKTNPDAEIAYTKISQRWNMPSRYFSIKKQIGKDSSKTAEIFFLDTNPFQKDYYTEEDYGRQVKTQDTAAQKAWLINGLKNSTATWKFVAGHHPLYSAGKRMGKTQDMINSFRDVFEKYKVDAYFCGHEHQLEYDQPEGYHFREFISGAGSEATQVGTAPFAKFAVSDHGFMTVSVTDNEMLIQYINYKGEILYSKSFEK